LEEELPEEQKKIEIKIEEIMGIEEPGELNDVFNFITESNLIVLSPYVPILLGGNKPLLMSLAVS
jgi:hypothetical protein